MSNTPVTPVGMAVRLLPVGPPLTTDVSDIGVAKPEAAMTNTSKALGMAAAAAPEAVKGETDEGAVGESEEPSSGEEMADWSKEELVIEDGRDSFALQDDYISL
jgi:hypothetical protein